MEEVEQMERRGERWEEVCLGSFYVKPNYPGRSSHVCNGGFLVTEAARNRGVGRLMGEGYLEWAPKLVCRRFLGCCHSFSTTQIQRLPSICLHLRFFPLKKNPRRMK